MQINRVVPNIPDNIIQIYRVDIPDKRIHFQSCPIQGRLLVALSRIAKICEYFIAIIFVILKTVYLPYTGH